jgi:hypothetical protein
MKTFDLAEVREFTTNLDAQMDRCDNGEGMECASLDAALIHYTTLCCDYLNGVRQWGRGVFSGRVSFDQEVEQLWLAEGWRLLDRATEMLLYGQSAEIPCYTLDGQKLLQSALWELLRMLEGWVTPKLAVRPSARQDPPLSPVAAEEALRRIESLPPLPENWQPDDPRQQAWYKNRRTS